MAAYGALVSLMHIINTLEKHPSPPISINEKQVESLTQNVTFLQEFLDAYMSPVVVDGHEADPLERRIADAVYAAEDAIESKIVLRIQRPITMPRCIEFIYWNMVSFIKLFRGVRQCLDATATIEEDLYHDLQQVIEEMDLIKKEAMETAAVAQLQRDISSTSLTSSSTVKENVMVEKIVVASQLQQKTVAASTSSSTVKDNMMVGFEEVFLEVLDKLTGDQLNRQIIPITGMGGIGKTTLAKDLFENALVKEHFDIRAWTTISQTFNVRETLREVLSQASGVLSSDLSEDQLRLKLHKFLWGRRYLVIMDDMWSVEVWEKIKFFFPDNNNGSRIIVTTRLSNLSFELNDSYRVRMKFLDKSSSWRLFCNTVFGKESCPLEFENIGKNIVANCKGLPLSIATIGGLLAKSEFTTEYWELIEQNLNSIVINNNDEFCLKTLRMSYIYLPNYLKPCFLYMGVFEEDRRIRVSMLKKLWISEGFLKPRSGKCLETIAQEYFKELVDRNLILFDLLGSTGNVKYCKIHDLLRDLCLKEVEKERFYHVVRDAPSANNSERRVVFPRGTAWLLKKGLGYLSHVRSIICDDIHGYWVGDDRYGKVQLPHNLRLLRTFNAYEKSTMGGAYLLDNVFESVNSRYLSVRIFDKSKFPASIDLLWNLHSLIIQCYWHNLIAPIEIWKLHQLRHLIFNDSSSGLTLRNPPSGDKDIVIMENLQTLKGVKSLILNEEVVKRIPNVKKLHLIYDKVKQMGGENGLNYLQCLSKLENFRCTTRNGCHEYLQRITFPHSLKKLSIIPSSNMEWEDIMPKIGSLPLLEKLVLSGGLFKTGKWETIEGQFTSLKFLGLEYCTGLKDWIVSDNSHFPLLQTLHLTFVSQLKEIPSEVGEIATLKSIKLYCCSKSVVKSAKKIVEEQEDLYGDQLDLHVHAVIWENRRNREELKRLETANFEVE